MMLTGLKPGIKYRLFCLNQKIICQIILQGSRKRAGDGQAGGLII